MNAPNVVLDLGGHTVDGTGSGLGVILTGGNGITLKNGKVREFETGVFAGGTNGSTASGITTSDNAYAGLSLNSGSNNKVTGNIASNNKVGGIVLFGTGHTVTNNQVTGSVPGVPTAEATRPEATRPGNGNTNCVNVSCT